MLIANWNSTARIKERAPTIVMRPSVFFRSGELTYGNEIELELTVDTVFSWLSFGLIKSRDSALFFSLRRQTLFV